MNIKGVDVAIIGMSGKFPGADSVAGFWDNLCAGRESIRTLSDEELRAAGVTEADLADPDYVKAGAPLHGVDRFDSGFFKVSPLEAELMDPQIRLLLQCGWEALEEAGYAGRQARNVGVFAGGGGVGTSYFSHFVNLDPHFEKITASPTHLGNDKDFLATYLSYKLNLTGPSLTVQTACSTSLVALHQARLSLAAGECDMALAGGVSVRVPHAHGYRYRDGYIFSKSGRIRSFDAAADGVVFGSGLGLVLIKRLEDAIRDRDPIRAVIKGSAIGNDGKGKLSYAASSARGQMACIRAALANAGVDAASIGLVESHGTGTAMGDPEEVKALSAAFKQDTELKGYCALGAVKANIGHLEAAAGIVGLIKATLAVEHGLIPPMAHFDNANGRIKFEQTPFFVNRQLQPWRAGKQPRRAAVNSLGVGGTNAFVIVEAYPAPKRAGKRGVRSGGDATAQASVIVPLSARTDESLRAYAGRLSDFIGAEQAAGRAPDPADLAYTLQLGRDAMECRAVFVADGLASLRERLTAFAGGAGDDGDAATPLPAIAADWRAGGEVDWDNAYTGERPRRIALPTYAFAAERHWIDSPAPAPMRAALHPLLHANVSDLDEIRYCSQFDGEEAFLRDHRVRGALPGDDGAVAKVLPGVAYLEMARAAISLARPAQPAANAPALELREIVWLQPLVVAGERRADIAVIDRGEDHVDFEVFGDDEAIHCQGQGVFAQAPPAARIDLDALRRELGEPRWEAESLYAMFAGMGLEYGPSHRAIQRLRRDRGQVLATLRLPPAASAGKHGFALHPSLMDGALQAATCVLIDPDDAPAQPLVPFALSCVRLLAACPDEVQVWARRSQADAHGGASLDIDLCDNDGNVCVQMRGFLPRALGKSRDATVLATRVWREQAPAATAQAMSGDTHVWLCDLPAIDAAALDAQVARIALTADGDEDAPRYSELALACFQRLQALLAARPRDALSVQIVVADEARNAVFAGLSGLLKTARIENPRVAAQLLLVEAGVDTAALAARLAADRGGEGLIRYRDGRREVAAWETLESEPGDGGGEAALLKEQGVYLITGGLGGLGAVFARDILRRCGGARLILTGRASAAELAKSPARTALLQALRGDCADPAQVEYRRMDPADPAQVRKLIAAVRKQHGQLNGIIHSAGMTADGWIIHKRADEFARVLAPKVAGTRNLDRASAGLDLDFFALFSSLSAALGNAGQADYAAANGFMDEFATRRNAQVAAGQRQGRTLAIAWPYWQEGGMRLDAAGEAQLHDSTGIRPMRTATGLRMFYRGLADGHDRVVVMQGDRARMHAALDLGVRAEAATAQADPAANAAAPSDLLAASERYLCEQLSAVLKLPAHRLDPRAPLEDYGIDSILALDLTRALEKTFGALPKTLFFEYLNIRDLAAHFARAYAPVLRGLCADGAAPADADALPAPAAEAERAAERDATPAASVASLRRRHRALADQTADRARAPHRADEPIAIVGLSGRYPQARDLDEYWRNLRDGRDCIVEVPAERWDWREYYSDDRSQPGHHYSKWGGFIEGVDEFDARFFNISPLEAATIDPQERLFLQHAWMAIEDAGYSRAALRIDAGDEPAGQVGVYAGVMYSEYQLLGAEASLSGRRMGFASNPASIANRVSYVLNLHGPSMTVDTMCSSSLTAIHLACQDLKLGRTDAAIAGGVNVSIHPNKYLMLSAGQFISGDGHCQSFGEGGDGYIPGEGVGVAVLKRLSDAQRDGNQIYGVIRGSALSHGGKTNGYTVPNPQAQASAIRQALRESGIPARRIGYLEAHGTGTKLGDPIEIAALSKVFRESTQDNGYCLIGSAKSNIGHCEAAAGIAGLSKVLLQLRHGQIVPSLHSARLNPHIDFASSPFVVNQSLRDWDAPRHDGRALPRVAGISSFGAGGSNAHLIVEEYRAPVAVAAATKAYMLPLSARTPEQLRDKARDLLVYLRDQASPSPLRDIAHTLQLGRDAMDARLGVVADTHERLAARLQDFLDERAHADLHQGQVKAGRDALDAMVAELDPAGAMERWIAEGVTAEPMALWVKGWELDWRRFDPQPARFVSLPAYPFARQRHWVDVAPAPAAAGEIAVGALHPLLHRNTSDFGQHGFQSSFAGDEFFIVGTDAGAQLSAAACVEMARAAAAHALAPLPAGDRVLELRELAWARPGVALDHGRIAIALLEPRVDGCTFEIHRPDAATDADEAVHCQGRVHVLAGGAESTRLDLAQLRRTAPGQLHEVSLPTQWHESRAAYGLHPALLQAVLRAAGAERPRALASLRIVRDSADATLAWIRPSGDGYAAAAVDIDLCDARGEVSVQLRGLLHADAVVAPVTAVTAPAAPVTAATSVSRRIEITASASMSMHESADAFAPSAALSKPDAIALTAPGAAASASPPVARAKPLLSLAAAATPAVRAPVEESAGIALFDDGGGVFSLRIDDGDGDDLNAASIAYMLRCLDAAGREPALKALVIAGDARRFAGGDGAAHRAALDAGLYRAIAAFACPVIAAMRGDAHGAGFVLGAVCDFMVCDRDGGYGFTDAARALYPDGVQDLFETRLGPVLARDFLYLSAGAQRGAQLLDRGWTCPIVAAAEVEPTARALAADLAKKSRESLQLLKAHLARPIVAAIERMGTGAADVVPDQADLTEAAAALPQTGPHLRLEVHGERVLSIRVAGADGEGWLSELERVVASLGPDSPYRSVLLSSEGEPFLGAVDAASAKRCVQALSLLELPLIAALHGDATGPAWLIAQCCDAAVHSEQGRYAGEGLLDTGALAALATRAFAERFGEDVGKRLLLSGETYSGADLRRECAAVRVVAAAQVGSEALALAETLAGGPREVSRRWRRSSVERLALDVADLAAHDDAPDLAVAPTEFGAAGDVIRVIAHAHGVVEVRMADREARNMFSEAFSRGMAAAFAHIQADPGCKAVVLTGYDQYFASGGTRDTLLAIHEGRARFTDNKVFELPLHCPVPVIAAMQGHGVGAGWALGMYADVCVFGEASRYFSPYMGYGFTPGAGSTLVFAHRIGHDLARESLLTAREYSGDELKARGLAHPVLPREQVVEAALRMAARIARLPRQRLIALKRDWTGALRRELPDTFERELAMHARTFVGQSDTLARILGGFGEQPAAPSVEVRAPSAQARPAGDDPAIVAELKALLAHELRMGEDEIGEDEQFVDLGLDSITGVTWVRKINERYGTAIEAIKVYSYPTLQRLAAYVGEQAGPADDVVTVSAAAPVMAPDTVSAAVADIVATLKKLLADELRMAEHDIGEDEQFVDLGLDSITGVTWVRKINERYGTAIEAIKVYSYPTLARLSAFVAEQAPPSAPVAMPPAMPALVAATRAIATTDSAVRLRSWRGRQHRAASHAATSPLQPIAVIGMAGQFAQSGDLQAFWRNIAQGRDCIAPVPPQRWDIERYHQAGEAAAGKTNSRWIGTLDDYDRFDPAFFNISPREARAMDPQQRLFLQACWHGIEHAGYNPKALAGSKCGVFVGCAAGDYHQLSRREQLSGQGFTGAAPSILAARISYFLDLHGPSVALDTACSSSLVAIASACDSLALGASDLALAGGVNVMAGPAMQIMTAQVGMLSPQGRCRSFDAQADGIATGEGVGVVLLKRLSDAERDGDRIYGVVEGWGVNQDGRTNGITAPNEQAQTRLQREVYERFGIDPDTIGLIEAHGTGTALGDPIEVAGLKAAFAPYTQRADYCALGSVKSNVGHCLSAAGISGFIKLLLAIEHRQLPPTVHFRALNPHIALDGSPFYVNARLREWTPGRDGVRRGAVNSFGFSGTNAHAVVAEYRAPIALAAQTGPALVPLSATSPAQLRLKAAELLEFIDAPRADALDLHTLAHTLQTGRDGMDERVAIVADSLADLGARLRAFLAYADGHAAALPERICRAQASAHRAGMSAFAADPDFQRMLDRWVQHKQLSKLADLWVKGSHLDWRGLYPAGAAPRRMALPLHPFVKERYWIEADEDTGAADRAAPAAIHPLLQLNTSDLSRQKYRTRLSENDPLRSVRHRDGMTRHELPALACVEIARAALIDATPSAQAGGVVRLSAMEWSAPIDASGVRTALAPLRDGRIGFEIGADDEPATVQCRGIAEFIAAPATPASLDVGALRASMRAGSLDPALLYAGLAAHGADYPAQCRGLSEIAVGDSELWVRLDLPEALHAQAGRYVLHPWLLQAAFHAAASLLAGVRTRFDAVPVARSLQSLEIAVASAGSVSMQAWVRRDRSDHGRADLDLCDAHGAILASIRGLAIGWGAHASGEQVRETAIATAAWSAPPHVDAAALPLAATDAVISAAVPGIEAVQRELRDSLAEALFMRPAEIAPNKTFTELGLDSIIGVEWVKALNKRFGSELSATRIYDYPSVKSLAEYLHGLIAAQPGAVAVAETSVVSAALAPAATVTAATPGLDAVQRELRDSLAEALFMRPAEIAPNKTFTELGLDSIIGVEWVKALNKRFGSELSATRIYDYPSVAQLAQYLHGEIGARTPAPAPAPIQPAAPRIGLDALQQQLRASLAEALFMQPGEIGLDKLFTELGLDSIIGVEWIKGLNKQYGTAISAIKVYDYPSVRSMAAHVAAQLPQSEPVSEPAPAPTPVATPVRAVAASAAIATVRAAPAASSRFQGHERLRFEPKYDPAHKSLYFYSGDGAGDFERDGEFALHYAFSPETNVCLREHVVFGEHLLPTDAYLELVCSACATYFQGGPLSLRDIAIVNPLLGAEGRDSHVRLLLRRAGEELQFFVKSSPSGRFDDEIVHMHGFVALSAPAAETARERDFAVERELAAGEIATNTGVHYAPLRSLAFGESSALGRIRVAAHGLRFSLDPFVLYGGLCTVINYAAHLAGKHYGASDDQFLPHRIGRVAVFDGLNGDAARDSRCYAQVRTLERDAVEMYFEIIDDAGRVLLSVDGIHLRRVGRAALRQAARAQPPATAMRAGGAVEKVAIVGMACRYPMSENLEAFWRNLSEGRDCVGEVPAERWNGHDWYHPDPRHPHTSYSKWAGLLDRIDAFDPLFFGISPAEAELTDPQQRIFLEECWKSIENAGYAPGALSDQACGVYVGCAAGDYARVLSEAGQDTAGTAFMGTSNAILAARIAYYLNLKGPALAIDTACSSSLVAVHLACESIRSGENRWALAGGINLLTTPLGHILTSQVGMPSRDGRCASFDASANGIVFSEGCGVLLLKALSQAKADNDRILGVIEGSGSNQDGKTNGITAPSSNAQERLLRQVYAKFGIDPKRIGYVEAHGTATPLGDPIEVNALGAVYGPAGAGLHSCALGSVKSNIGHTGFAAGVAGMIKVLLCMQHKQLVPSIHYRQPNPHIRFDTSPFYVNTQRRDWISEGARMATVSSFGFSGTNAHVVIAEHSSSFAGAEPAHTDEPRIVPLSARSAEQLRDKARDLLAWLRREPDADLRRLAHTAQVGRDAMEHRLGFIATSIDALTRQLSDYLDGATRIDGVYRGRADSEDETLAVFAGDEDMRRVFEQWIERRQLPKLLELWVRGLEIDWNRLYAGERPRRMALPDYPFARERHWVAAGAGARGVAASASRLHPLLHLNTSDLNLQSYRSVFDGDEFFLADHRVNQRKVLPAVAYLEMARAAVADALPPSDADEALELRHVVWAQPLTVERPQPVGIAVFAQSDGEIQFEVYSEHADGEDSAHCQGLCVSVPASAQPRLDLSALQAQMRLGRIDGAELYPRFAAQGLGYGPSFQGVSAIWQDHEQLLVELELPAAVATQGYVLHPALMDSALQGSILLIERSLRAHDGVEAGVSLPFALESLRIHAPCAPRMRAWVRYSPGPRSAGLIKVDIDLCDGDGAVCVSLRGFASRRMDARAQAFDESHYLATIARVANNELSADQAVELG